jgi:trans-aconitate methyltransferase
VWNVAQYERFGDERTRPFFDLVLRIPALGDAERIVDLGCGTGANTRLLAERWPHARVVGIDSSAEMLLAARAHPEPVLGRLRFEQADLRSFAPAQPVDLIVSVEAWETTYLHLLRGEDPVLEWMRGTTLRPILERLGPEDGGELLEQYRHRLREAYPPLGGGTTFPFRRLFVVARRG